MNVSSLIEHDVVDALHLRDAVLVFEAAGDAVAVLAV